MKKFPLSFQLKAEDFLPASDSEKQELVVMRDSVSFWKDGLRRLLKNKVASVYVVHEHSLYGGVHPLAAFPRGDAFRRELLHGINP